jgi:hypothetical protein
MPVIVQRRPRLLLFVCGKHSVPSRTPFRQATKTVRLATGMAFAFTTEYCSDSQRNGVRLQTGIAFIFDRIPHHFDGRARLNPITNDNDSLAIRKLLDAV